MGGSWDKVVEKARLISSATAPPSTASSTAPTPSVRAIAPKLLACKATGEQGIEAAPVGLTKFIAGIIDFTRSE